KEPPHPESQWRDQGKAMQARPDSVASLDGRYTYFEVVLPRLRLDPGAASVYLAGFQWERYREMRRQARFVSETRSSFVEKGKQMPLVVLEPGRMGGEALVDVLGRARPAVVLPIDVENLTNLVL